MSRLTNPMRVSARDRCGFCCIGFIAIVASSVLLAIALVVLLIMYPHWPYWTEVAIWIGFAALVAYFGSVLVSDVMSAREDARTSRRGVDVNERGVPIQHAVLQQNKRSYGRNQQS